MALEGEYEPSPARWVRDQVEKYERSRGTEGNTLGTTEWPIVVVTSKGRRSGKVRKTPLMRVEHNGEYALIGSMGGAPSNPQWVHNLRAGGNAVTLQDGAEPFPVEVHEVDGEARAVWWERAVAAYPPYADYQERTTRRIPVFVATRRR